MRAVADISYRTVTIKKNTYRQKKEKDFRKLIINYSITECHLYVCLFIFCILFTQGNE